MSERKAAECSGFTERLRRFLLPEINRRLLIRLLLIVLIAVTFFSVFKPCFVSGSSMEPTFGNNRISFSFRLSYLVSPPRRGDVVTIAFFGRKELLKRVVALPGDTVSFHNGKLVLNGEIIDEPYLKKECNWDLSAVTVRPGHCFVVGDNRSQSHLEHRFGEVEIKRITGEVLF